ncbi:MAG: proteasome-activating nucleotidase [Candidatus Diapherotrites archaeon]|uniref:Proteasome-activating nucleotidase n=1 Tax=Candidatus Iainarchaeum sp. TaxID=3101447 RepID=A0A8T4C7G4_9ARCH|nr:proteasome-activating nucleotidase [Candidatus Diapherotrites archaeon]
MADLDSNYSAEKDGATATAAPANASASTGRRNVTNFYDYVYTLEEQVRLLQSQNTSMEEKTLQLDGEIKRLKNELERFKTPPLMVGTVQDILPEGKCIVRNSNGIEFLVTTEMHTQLTEKEVGKRVSMSQKNLAVIGVLPDWKDARAKAMELVERPTETFELVGGLEEEIQQLREAVILPLTHPEKFERLGIQSPSGVLLHGPPGTGKTLLAKAIANESKAAFIGLVGSELVHKYIGEGAKLVRDVFALAKEKEHAIIFIDEIDAIGTMRTDDTSGGDREVQRTLIQLLAEIDGFKDRKNIKLVAATNRIDVMDAALLRPGRFDRIVEVPMPSPAARKKIVNIHTKGMNLHKDVNLDKIIERTEGMTGADIKSICLEAGMHALRDDATKVQHKHFEKAVTKVIASRNTSDPEFENAKKMFN